MVSTKLSDITTTEINGRPELSKFLESYRDTMGALPEDGFLIEGFNGVFCIIAMKPTDTTMRFYSTFGTIDMN